MKKFKDVDTYIANADEIARPKLEELRKLVKSTIPQAEEKIWYGVPFFFHYGELVGFDEYKKHVSFGIGAAVMTSEVRDMFEAKGYKTGKGTIQIKYGQRVPTTAIRQILKSKAKMNEAKER